MKKTSKIITLSVITLMILSLLGLSYAYFIGRNIRGNNTNNTVFLDTIDYGQITVTYENDNDTIDATDLVMSQTTSGVDYNFMLKFDIRNTGDRSADVNVNWKKIDNSFCQNTASVDECTNTGPFVGNELNYALYSCTSQQYAGITTADDADITSCTKLTATPNPAVPISTAQIKDITLPATSQTYYVLVVTVKNLSTLQNYQSGVSFVGSIAVEYPSVVVFGLNTLTFDNTDMLAYKILADRKVTKFTTPATTTKSTTLWIPTENEWKTLVCDSTSAWYHTLFCNYCSPQHTSYDATECSSGYNTYVTSEYVVGENGIFSVTNANGTSYYYRGGEGCSILGSDITSTYSTAATCIAANGNWVGANTNFKCYANGTPEACATAGGTWNYLNNNVSFAGFNWKIVRINEDGSIRIVLDGLTSTVKKTGSNSFAGSNSPYNTSYNAGAPSAANEATAIDYASYTGSDLEDAIQSFYETYIDNSATLNTINYSSYLADSTFCSDTTWFDTSAATWSFNSYNRISSSLSPTYECPNGSTYKVTNSPGITLSHPIGTLSIDEIRYGGVIKVNSSTNVQMGPSMHYLHNLLTITEGYWSMSPRAWSPFFYITSSFITPDGRIDGSGLNTQHGVRPVLNLRSDVMINGGTGTIDDPYQIGD